MSGLDDELMDEREGCCSDGSIRDVFVRIK